MGTPYAPARPGYGPSAAGTLPRPTNTMAILAIVFAVLFPPLGIVLAAIARRQVSRTNEEGGTLATVSLVLGIVLTALQLLALVAWVVFAVFVVTHAHDLPGPSVTPFAFPSGQDA